MIQTQMRLYVVGETSSDAVIRVPCWNLSEAAMVECYLTEKSCVRSIRFENCKWGETHPGLIREAAEYVYKAKRDKFNSRASGKPAGYLIRATARRILTPLHQKKQSEIKREQIRNQS